MRISLGIILIVIGLALYVCGLQLSLSGFGEDLSPAEQEAADRDARIGTIMTPIGVGVAGLGALVMIVCAIRWVIARKRQRATSSGSHI